MHMSTQTQPREKPPNSPLVDAALARTLPGISPAGLLEAIENPNVIEGAARGDLYVQLGILRQLSASHTFSVAHRLQYATLLAKLGKVMGADAVDGNVAQAPNVNIVFENSAEPRPIQSRPVLSVVQPGDRESGRSAVDTQDTLDFLPDFSEFSELSIP
jgi:hypothetical protein